LPEVEVGPAGELPPGSMKMVALGDLEVGVYNCGGELFALEDRCSHDDGPLCEGAWDTDRCVVVCPRHGSEFDLRTGRPRTLPAYLPVRTFAVRVVDGTVFVDLTQ